MLRANCPRCPDRNQVFKPAKHFSLRGPCLRADGDGVRSAKAWTGSSSRGGKRLEGRIPISGAKNAALTLMPCALLTDEPLTLRNLPRLADVDSFGHLFNQLGVSTTIEGARPGEFGRVMTLRAATIVVDDGALRHRPQDARLDPRARPAGRPGRRSDGVAARRLRDRQPADRPASEGAAGAGRRDRARRRLCEGDGAQGRPDRRPDQLPHRVGRRDRERADGGGARQGRDGDRECRARARDHRPRAMPQRDGRRGSAAFAPTRSRSRASTGCTAPPMR